MIDIRKLKELVRLMVDNDLTELDLRDSEEQVTLRRPGPRAEGVAAAPAAWANHLAMTAPHVLVGAGGGHGPGHGGPAQVPPAPSADAAVADGAAGLLTIASPMVGTYYARPNPDSDTFVNVGSRVGPDTVVCLVEAMKIFNEIKAELSGTIEQVLVSSGDAIEFGQPLFRVRPD